MPEPFDLATAKLDVHPEISDFLARNPEVEPRTYRDGEFLVREGEESQEIFVLLSGGLVVERAPAVPGTPPVILACLSVEEEVTIVGEMAYLGALRRTASVRSSGMSHTLCLGPAQVDRIIEGFPMLTRVICRQFSRRLQETLEALSRHQGRFAMNASRRMAQDGDVLFAKGDHAGQLIQLMAGAVRLDLGERVEVVTPEALPGGLLDLGPYLTEGIRPATATVEGMAFLAVMEASERETVVRTFPELVLDVLKGARK